LKELASECLAAPSTDDYLNFRQNYYSRDVARELWIEFQEEKLILCELKAITLIAVWQ
jgi:hypothetical protein